MDVLFGAVQSIVPINEQSSAGSLNIDRTRFLDGLIGPCIDPGERTGTVDVNFTSGGDKDCVLIRRCVGCDRDRHRHRALRPNVNKSSCAARYIDRIDVVDEDAVRIPTDDDVIGEHCAMRIPGG